MIITLSVALSADNHIDDNSAERLTLSTASDWRAVHQLRSQHDAILIGGETLRRDNPRLGLKGVEGRPPRRVVVSGRGVISPSLKIFNSDGGEVIVFSNIERPELSGMAEVITSELLDVAFITTELERRGITSLFVEGGAVILNLFLGSGEVNNLRVARNPMVVVNDAEAPHFDPNRWIEGVEDVVVEDLEGMIVSSYRLTDRGVVSDHDRAMMRRAVEVSRNSPPKESCYRVGAVIEVADGSIYDGYTLETSPTHHAEQAAITKALESGASLAGATIYSTIEPCSTRVSEPRSCSELVVKYGFSRALFALYEPSHFVNCQGAVNMRRQGVDVICMAEFSDETLSINSHLF